MVLLSSKGKILSVAVAGYALYYMTKVAHVPLFAFSDKSALGPILIQKCPSLVSKFYPTFWCINTHAQTILGSIFRTHPTVTYARERIEIGKDGGYVALDWHANEELAEKWTSKTPIILILHGLTGGSQENYVKHLVLEAEQNGWRPVVFNNRGCANTTLATPQGYSAAYTNDLNEVAIHIHNKFPDAPLFAVGVSLGSIILTKYLAEQGEKSLIQGGMSISNAWDLEKSSVSLESFPSRQIYNRRLAENLKELVKRNLSVMNHPTAKKFDMDKILKSSTIREFDSNVIVPMFGYKDVHEYYSDATSVRHIGNVKVPYLCLNSADDPFSPGHGVPVEKFMENPNVFLLLTQRGGHIGFLEGSFPPFHAGLIERVFKEFFNVLLQQI